AGVELVREAAEVTEDVDPLAGQHLRDRLRSGLRRRGRRARAEVDVVADAQQVPARRRVDQAMRDVRRRVLDDEDLARWVEQVEVLALRRALADSETDVAGQRLGTAQVESADDL